MSAWCAPTLRRPPRVFEILRQSIQPVVTGMAMSSSSRTAAGPLSARDEPKAGFAQRFDDLDGRVMMSNMPNGSFRSARPVTLVSINARFTNGQQHTMAPLRQRSPRGYSTTRYAPSIRRASSQNASLKDTNIAPNRRSVQHVGTTLRATHGS